MTCGCWCGCALGSAGVIVVGVMFSLGGGGLTGAGGLLLVGICCSG